MAEWGRLSTWNCARNRNSTIRTSGTCPNQLLSRRMKPIILRNFEIQTDKLIPIRRTDLVINNKKKKKENLLNTEVYHPGEPQSKTQRKQKERQVLRPCQGTKMLWSMKVTVMSIIICFAQDDHQRLEKEARRVRNWRMNKDHPNYSIVEIGPNT